MFLVTLLFVSCNSNQTGNRAVSESAFDKILQTGVVRVGYFSYAPALVKDPNTGEFSGIMYDILMELSKNLNLKFEFVSETTVATMIEDIKTNKVDLICAQVLPTGARAKEAYFTDPIFFSSLNAYVQSNNFSLDNDIAKANSSNVRISVIDGEINETIANHDFPNAKQVSMQNIQEVSQMLVEVSMGKADLTFAEPLTAENFMRANPGKIREVEGIKPIKVFPVVYILKKGENQFQNMMNIALQELEFNGIIDKIIDKYEPTGKVFLRTAPMYTK